MLCVECGRNLGIKLGMNGELMGNLSGTQNPESGTQNPESRNPESGTGNRQPSRQPAVPAGSLVAWLEKEKTPTKKSKAKKEKREKRNLSKEKRIRESAEEI